MRAIIITSIIALFAFVFSGNSSIRALAMEKGTAALDEHNETQDSVKSGWSLYSFGLYYKYKALDAADEHESSASIEKAIGYFNDSLSHGEAPDEVYNQISDCYFYAKDFDLSIKYARRSIQANKLLQAPYFRIYQIHILKHENPEGAEILEEYLSIAPQSVSARYELGEHYYSRLRDLKKADKEFRLIIRLAKSRPVPDYFKKNAYSYLGLIAYRKFKFQRALRYYSKAHEIDPEDLEPVYFLASINMFYYNLDDAQYYSELYLQKNSKNTQIHSILGKVLYLREDPRAVYHLGMVKNDKSYEGLLATSLYSERLMQDEKAESLIRLVIKSQPQEITAYLAQARISLRKNDKDDAFKQYLTAGVLLYYSKQFHLAKVYLERADLLKNDVPDVQYYLGRSSEEMGSYAAAIRHFKKVNNAKPDSTIALHVGYLYGVIREYDNAMKWFRGVIEKEPNNAQAFFFSGMVWIWRERYADAEMNLKKAISIENSQEPFYFYLAITMDKTERFPKAIDYLKQAIKCNDKSARAYNYLGYIYADHNMMLDQSLALIKKALEIDPHNGAYVDSFGWVLYRQGDYKGALEKLFLAEKLLKKTKSPDPVVYDHIGDTYRQMGDYRKAIQYWQEAVKLEKNSSVERKIILMQKKLKEDPGS